LHDVVRFLKAVRQLCELVKQSVMEIFHRPCPDVSRIEEGVNNGQIAREMRGRRGVPRRRRLEEHADEEEACQACKLLGSAGFFSEGGECVTLHVGPQEQ